jgi:hypothetical protein
VNVGESVYHAIDDWEAGKLKSAMLHACNAIDGTAKKVYPHEGVGARFKRLLRENYDVLGPMGAPGLDVGATRFPVKVRRATAPGGKPDIADVIYGVRCVHSHGDELPGGFDLIPVAAQGPSRQHPIRISDGAVQFSDRIIFGLLAVAVLSAENVDQRVPDGYCLTYGSNARMEINEWWGRADDFPSILATDPPGPGVAFDFSDWDKGSFPVAVPPGGRAIITAYGESDAEAQTGEQLGRTPDP